jgi:hypothetical protein
MFFLIAIFVVLSTFCLAEGEDLLVEGIEGGDADDANLFGEGIEGGEETTTVDSLEEATTQPGIETTEDGTDFTNYEGELQINEVTPDDNIITQHGSFTNYQMNNALFMFGALAQASLFSFENNNYLFFGSIFDESQFQLILDEGGEGQITQRNSMGDMGRVYVSMDNGNLTQDDTMVFIPDGDNPTYIYYNTTDVEFEDGTIYYSDEAVTNLDNTDESSTVTFDEFGFTSVEIYEENNYTYNEYKFMNNEREMIKACKDDDSCEINIKEDYLKIEGKVDVYLNDELVINSLSSNNLFVLDDDELTFENTRGNGEILAYVYNGNFVIREETEGSFSDYSEGNPEWFDSYNEVDFIDGVLIYLDVLMFSYGVNCDSFYCTSLDFVSSIITGNVVSGESVREMLGF